MTGLSQSNVSRQLNMMLDYGVLARRKEGNQAYFKVTDETLIEVCRTVCVSIAARAESDSKKVKSSAKEFLLGMVMK